MWPPTSLSLNCGHFTARCDCGAVASGMEFADALRAAFLSACILLEEAGSRELGKFHL